MGFKDWVAKVTGRLEPERVAVTLSPPAPTEDDIMNALDRADAMVTGGVVPAPVQSRVKRITSTVRQTMPRLRNLGLGSAEAYSVMATATDYLPEAISGYLRLPRDWADSRPIEAGKTSLMLLIDQLDLLGSTMDKIFDAVVRVDAAALVAHGRFLQEKFGHPGNAPTAPPTMSPPSDTPRSSLDLP
ncbi:hypothetical protein GCM10022204_10440 [Microlunatus aurantiacus]|uniref:Uncharacterized protein n=1 Tax=Microlunatus aurantiacus TaxID=446786 RepID=A0ABP7CUC0_9ACTN